MEMSENGAIGWDDDVSEKDAPQSGSGEREEFVVLPPGEYDFRIAKVERGQFNGSEKLPPCNQVKVGAFIDGGDKGTSYVSQRFYMHTKMLWKIYRFLTSINLHKKGEGSGPIPWGKVVKGMEGRCKISVRVWNGKEQNEVEEWLEPSAGPLDEDW